MNLSTDEMRTLDEHSQRIYLLGRLTGMMETIDEVMLHTEDVNGRLWLGWKRQQVVDEFSRTFTEE